MGRKERDRKKRRERNRAKKALKGAVPARKRTFSGLKARKGDALEINFKFSGIPVPFDSTQPTENVKEMTIEVEKKLIEEPKGSC